MRKYILGRTIQAVISLLGISIIVFLAARLTGSPVDIMMTEYTSLEDRVRLERYLGLDKPLYVQYWKYISNAAKGEFGESTYMKRPVSEIILSRLSATLELGAVAILVAILIALPGGVYAAVKKGTLLDLLVRLFAVLGQSVPSWWFGLVLIMFFGVRLGVLPSGGRGGISSYILPAITMGWYVSAGIMRLVRSSMLDVLGSEYMKLARLKGLSEAVVIWKHGFKNALLPVLTFAAVVFVSMLAGSVSTELAFSWPGVGRLVVDAVMWRDFPIVQGVVLLLATMYILGNFVVDILYAYLNPRIRYEQ